jgi:ectoine hydroxylase-related dioxygenase (phytanoyl-CoA dioxygenase family)
MNNMDDKGYMLFENYFSLEEIDQITTNSKVELLEYPFTTTSSIKNLSIQMNTDKLLSTVNNITGNKFTVWHQKLHLKDAYEGYLEPYHQDFIYRKDAGLPNSAYLQCFIAVDNLTECPLNIFEGSHKLGLLEHVIGMERNGYSKYRISSNILKEHSHNFKSLYMKKGDMLLFDYLLIHGSASNASPHRQTRAVIQLIKEGCIMGNSDKQFKDRKNKEYEMLSLMLEDRKTFNTIPFGYPK